MSKFRPFVDVARYTYVHGGCTFDLDGNIQQDVRGYVVSPFPEHTMIVTFDGTLARSAIAASALKFALRSKRIALGELPSDTFLGTWLQGTNDNGQWHSGELHLDVVVVKQDLQEALDLAQRHNQLAIYDLANGCDIPTSCLTGFTFNINAYGHVLLERATRMNDLGTIAAGTRDIYLQSESDVESILDLLTTNQKQDLHNGCEVFIADIVPVANVLSEYFNESAS